MLDGGRLLGAKAVGKGGIPRPCPVPMPSEVAPGVNAACGAGVVPGENIGFVGKPGDNWPGWEVGRGMVGAPPAGWPGMPPVGASKT